MRIRLLLVVLCLVLGLQLPAQAVGTVTVTPNFDRWPIVSYTVAWTATAGGAVSGNAFHVTPGRLLLIRFDPGTPQPTADYDVTLVESGGVADLTAGGGTDLSNAADEVWQWDPPLWQDGTRALDVVVANAGNATAGTVTILVEVQ